MTTHAYLRVSTGGQDTEKNKADILLLADRERLGQVEWTEETVSGKVHWRKRTLGPLVDGLQKGDVLLVPELSRLGRSTYEIMEILSVLTTRGVCVFAVKGDWRLDGSIQSEIVAAVFALAARIERDLIVSRTTEALRAKKAAGVKLGRPAGSRSSKLDAKRPEIEALLANGSSRAFVARRYGVSARALYDWLKSRGISTPARGGRSAGRVRSVDKCY